MLFPSELSSDLGGLNDSGPHELICVNSQFPVGGPVSGGLGNVSLEGVCHWRRALRFQSRSPFSVPDCSLRCELSAAALAAAPPTHDGHGLFSL